MAMDPPDADCEKKERLDTPEASSPPQTQSTLGSLNGEDSTATIFGPDAATDAFDISPVAALTLLCMNIENLGQSTAEISEKFSTTVAATTSERTEMVKDPSRQEAKSPKVTELHCFRSMDHSAGQEKRELIQQAVLARRFVSKREPPIPLKEYLLRLHQYCPLSTAVYLATSIYITKLSAVEGLILVAPRNVHRLVLAGLRVAMKALEDLSYPHRRFAKVGGVSERELSRLEISFCFLTDFELRVDAQMLLAEARSIQSSTGVGRENTSS